MAGNNSLGTATLHLNADSKALEKDLKKAEKEWKDFQKKVGDRAKLAGKVAAIGVAGIAGSALAAVDKESPEMQRLTSTFEQLIKGLQPLFKIIVSGLEKALRVAMKIAEVLMEAFAYILESLAEWDILAESGAEFAQSLREGAAAMREAREEAAKFKAIKPGFDAKLADDVQATIDDLREQSRLVGATADEAVRFKLAWRGASAEDIQIIQEYQDIITGLQHRIQLEERAEQIIHSQKSALTLYREEVAKLQEMVDEGFLHPDRMLTEVEKLKEGLAGLSKQESPFSKWRADLAKLQELLNNNVITLQQYEIAVAQASTGVMEAGKSKPNAMQFAQALEARSSEGLEAQLRSRFASVPEANDPAKQLQAGIKALQAQEKANGQELKRIANAVTKVREQENFGVLN
jgi:hypothetical protein